MKTVIIAVLTVLLLCALTVVGIFIFMFSRMSDRQEGGDGSYKAGSHGAENGKMQESAPVPNSSEAPGNITEPGSSGTPSVQTPSAPEAPSSHDSGDSASFGSGQDMPSFEKGETGMPSGGPGGIGREPGGPADDDWLGDDPEETLSSVCKKDGIPSDAEAVEDISKLDGMWKAAECDSRDSDGLSYYRAEISVDGDSVTLSLTDPGIRSDNGALSNTGDYSGNAKVKNDSLSVLLTPSEDGPNGKGKASRIDLRNIYSSDGNLYAAGTVTDSSGSSDIFIALWKPQ